MTPFALGALVLAGILASLDWWAVATGRSALERVAKPGVVGALIIATLGLEPTAPEPVRLLMLAGLGASLVGDVLLLPGGSFSGGVLAFAGAQVAYLVAFSQQPLVPGALAIGIVVALVVAVAVGRPLLRAAPVGLLPAIAGYLVVILAMAATATGTAIPVAFAGAWLFVASDAMLARDRFVRPEAEDPPAQRAVVHATYHGAQALIVLSLLA